MAIVGYARVSTEGQNLSGQLAALKAAGATTIYREKVSGVRANRPQLAKLMAGLGAGDVVVVTKLDRLGRSTRELLDLIDRISKAGASFRSLGDPLWDTGSSQGRLLSTMLAAIAEFERELIRERTGEGRKRAMAAGVKFGRKRKLSDYQRAEAVRRRAAGETLASIARELRGRYLDDLTAASLTPRAQQIASARPRTQEPGAHEPFVIGGQNGIVGLCPQPRNEVRPWTTASSLCATPQLPSTVTWAASLLSTAFVLEKG